MTQQEAIALAEWLESNGVDRADVVLLGRGTWGVESYLEDTLVFTITEWEDHYNG